MDRDFHLTERQRAFFESDQPIEVLRHGQRGGRRLAMELWISATAADGEQAELAIEDLRTKGFACLDGEGNRVDLPGNRRLTIVRFDEEPKR